MSLRCSKSQSCKWLLAAVTVISHRGNYGLIAKRLKAILNHFSFFQEQSENGRVYSFSARVLSKISLQEFIH